MQNYDERALESFNSLINYCKKHKPCRNCIFDKLCPDFNFVCFTIGDIAKEKEKEETLNKILEKDISTEEALNAWNYILDYCDTRDGCGERYCAFSASKYEFGDMCHAIDDISLKERKLEFIKKYEGEG